MFVMFIMFIMFTPCWLSLVRGDALCPTELWWVSPQSAKFTGRSPARDASRPHFFVPIGGLRSRDAVFTVRGCWTQILLWPSWLLYQQVVVAPSSLLPPHHHRHDLDYKLWVEAAGRVSLGQIIYKCRTFNWPDHKVLLIAIAAVIVRFFLWLTSSSESYQTLSRPHLAFQAVQVFPI